MPDIRHLIQLYTAIDAAMSIKTHAVHIGDGRVSQWDARVVRHAKKGSRLKIVKTPKKIRLPPPKKNPPSFSSFMN